MSDKWSLKHRSKVSTLCLCFKLISWLICGPQRAEIDISHTHKWRKCLENYTLSSGSVLWHIKLLKQLSLLLPSNLRSRCIWEFMFHLLWPNPSGSLSHLNSFPPGLFCTGPIRDVYLIHWGFCMISDISELRLVFTFLRSVLCCSVTLSRISVCACQWCPLETLTKLTGSRLNCFQRFSGLLLSFLFLFGVSPYSLVFIR